MGKTKKITSSLKKTTEKNISKQTIKSKPSRKFQSKLIEVKPQTKINFIKNIKLKK